MFYSMTGYGRHDGQSEHCSQTWEIRSVNGKQLAIRWKIPSFLASMEAEFEKMVREAASRGRVDIGCTVQIARSKALRVTLNAPLATAMLDKVEELARERGEKFEPDYNRLLHISALWQDLSAEPDPDVLADLTAGLRQALEAWNRSRHREGEALRVDLAQRTSRLVTLLENLRTATESLAPERFASLKERVGLLLDEAGASFDNERMFQELALIADRMDVSEELTRLGTHFVELKRLLDKEQGGGRRLDFLLQECFREINTCGNKAQDTQVSRIVIEIKTELEKCREQVQNLE